MNSKCVMRLFQVKAGDTDTNHARGYVVNPTAEKGTPVAMSDGAYDGLWFGSMWGECQSGPFVKDAR